MADCGRSKRRTEASNIWIEVRSGCIAECDVHANRVSGRCGEEFSPDISLVINLQVKNGRAGMLLYANKSALLPYLPLSLTLFLFHRRRDWSVIYGAASVNRVMHGDNRMKLTEQKKWNTRFLSCNRTALMSE